MKPKPKKYPYLPPWPTPGTILMIQAPLPNCLDTLPLLVIIEGRGSGRQGPSPSAPPEEPAND